MTSQAWTCVWQRAIGNFKCLKKDTSAVVYLVDVLFMKSSLTISSSGEQLNKEGQQHGMMILEVILFTLLKCPWTKHWICSSSSGAGLHHFSAFHPLQHGKSHCIFTFFFLFFNKSWQLVLQDFGLFLLSPIFVLLSWLLTMTSNLQPNSMHACHAYGESFV